MNDHPTPTMPPTTWAILAQALHTRRPVAATYNGHRRVICPHALDWNNGRPKLLAYQISGATSTGPLPTDTTQRWRSMFIDNIEHPIIIDRPWQTADNYTPRQQTGIDTTTIQVTTTSG